MIEINGIRYAKNEKEALNSLFTQGGTATKFYKKLKNRIEFFNEKNELFAALIVTPNFQGFVNAVQIEGKKHYQYAASEINEKLFGVPEKYSEQFTYAKNTYNQTKER